MCVLEAAIYAAVAVFLALLISGLALEQELAEEQEGLVYAGVRRDVNRFPVV